ncbi:MAG: hypothetical protein IJ950_03085, partial [Helicobacter sp.]|nr:hypothetical protein [Helicobacter sp.]
GVPTPCASVSVILPSARGLKKFNDDYPIMQDLVSSGVFSDKGIQIMRILKVLYVCWIIFWGLACILGFFVGHNATFAKMLYVFVLVCLFPLLPYFYYLIYEKTKSKNIFVAICCYLA